MAISKIKELCEIAVWLLHYSKKIACCILSCFLLLYMMVIAACYTSSGIFF